MPKPHPTRDKFLKYLRGPLAHDQPWVDVSGCYPAYEVRDAIREVSRTDVLFHKIINFYVRTRLPRMKIAEAIHYDSSTVKRKLDEGADLVLHHLKFKRLNVDGEDHPVAEVEA